MEGKSEIEGDSETVGSIVGASDTNSVGAAVVGLGVIRSQVTPSPV